MKLIEFLTLAFVFIKIYYCIGFNLKNKNYRATSLLIALVFMVLTLFAFTIYR